MTRAGGTQAHQLFANPFRSLPLSTKSGLELISSGNTLSPPAWEKPMLFRPFATVLAASLALVASTKATTLINTGFESPDYAAGNLVGQQGWDAAGFFEDDVVNVMVQNSVVKTGSQAVSLTGSGQGAGAFAYKLTPFLPVMEQQITIDFDMQWGTGGSVKSALYGVQTYDTDLNLVGSVGVSQLFGFYNAVVFDDQGSPIAIPGAVVNPGEWHHFQLVLDYASQSYHASMDGFTSATIPFQSLDVTDYGEADLFRDAGLGNANDTAYFDNLSSISSIVPEPASLGMLGGLAAILMRRRA